MSITLDATQLETVLDALYDAGEYRWAAPVGCQRCNGQVLCGDHEADVRKGIRYANLARQLCKPQQEGEAECRYQAKSSQQTIS